MAEEIKIKIGTEYDGAAAQKAKKDEEALQKGAKAAPGTPASPAAQAAKALDAEKLITKENEKQHALAKAKAGHHKMSGGRMVGDTLDMVTGQNGWVMRTQQLGNLMHMLKAAPMLIAPLIVGAAAVGFLGLRKSEEAKDREEQHRIGQARLDSDLHFARSGRFGNSEQAFSEELDAADNQKRLQAKRAQLVDRAHSGIGGALFGDFFEKGNALYRPDSALEIQKVDNDQREEVHKQRKAQLEKRAWFEKIGKREIEIAKAEAAGNMVEARGIQDELTAAQEYQRLDKSGANEQEIHEGVVAKLQNVQRERAGQLARLVTARDGAADTAAVAREAGSFRSGGNAEAVWNKIHGTMQKQHAEAMAAITHVDHTKR
ncbi:hypothetical protein CfE428DRAFT_5792 [Chthoniobacter flavus Ellin428]|uniref:Uncharacterized protein n=1 Tax=Chthoniobacter flavus Ellin428 TaxID=497964 RepID=B4DA52_9BACT|nr:hypothetical protein [Chthoniobacter flavus]EDY16679.1 hypothetical protein CfE428DRAFT_5792 [Chthoniobacter flavus Ellin428]TCO87252.1 hypothetical protein EV701_12389 [Chthoniobacter flavus]